MARHPTYAGTRGRAPCPSCEGRGYDIVTRSNIAQRVLCVVCNGTRVQPRTHAEATLSAANRIAGIRRAQRAR